MSRWAGRGRWAISAVRRPPAPPKDRRDDITRSKAASWPPSWRMCRACRANGVRFAMPVDIRVPALGESVVEATVNRWFKPEGSAVTEGEDLVELDTDKVNVTIPAEASGVLEKIVKKEGETVAVNDVLGVLNESATGDAAGARPFPCASVWAPASAGTATRVSAAGAQTEAQGNGRAPAASPV